jgi:predicted DNA-binding transcriptional regulator
MNFDIHAFLRKFGLREKEALLYGTCLQLNSPQPVAVIARKAQLLRSTAYSLLQGLVEQGLISRHVRSNVQHFSALPPDSLLEFLQDRQRLLSRQTDELRAFLPKLRQFVFQGDFGPPVTRFFQGKEQVQALLDGIFSGNQDFCVYRSCDSWMSSQMADLLPLYMKCFDRVRVLLHDTSCTRELLPRFFGKKLPFYFSESFRFLPSDVSCFSGEVILLEGRTLFLTFVPIPSAILLEGSFISSNQLLLFEHFWNLGK